MGRPGLDYRRLREAFRRGDHRRVLAAGEHVVADLDADPDQAARVAPAMLMIGASLLQVEHYRESSVWLEQGLARLDGSSAERDIGDAHWYHRSLVDIYLLVGRWAEAAAYLEWLARPDQPLDSRLAAARGQATLAAARGDTDQAQWLVNTAADLARRAHSNFLQAMVEADRVMVLASQARLREAVEFADAVGPQLAAPARGAEQAWANAQATAMYTQLARRLAVAGDLMTAERYLLESHAPAAESHRTFCSVQLELARAVVRREEGELERAEEPLRGALRQFEALGARPAMAVALLEDAELARRMGLTQSADSLLSRATAEMKAVGMHTELAMARRRWSEQRPSSPHPRVT